MENFQRTATDRLTQLQDMVNLQAENFCNSIGVLQMYAKESPFSQFNVFNNSFDESLEKNLDEQTDDSSEIMNAGMDDSNQTVPNISSKLPTNSHTDNKDNKSKSSSPKPEQDNCQFFAHLIARTAKNIDTLIDSLPPTSETESEQYYSTIKQLDEENAQCIVELEEAIKEGESILEVIRNALDEIAQIQLKSQLLNDEIA